MDVEKVFHMAGGNGPTSYARNSSLQKKATETVKHITLEAVQQLYLEMDPKTINIADLGCSSGPNTLEIMKDMVETVEKTGRQVRHDPSSPELHFYLNDLPQNDFNSVFKALPDFRKKLRDDSGGRRPLSVFVGGYSGSFYGRLFPSNNLHFVHSSNSLHWLSKVPAALYNEKGESINKGNIYISKSSPPEVPRAYLKQFQEDFSSFLHSRSEEIVAGGRMVLIFLGRIGPDHAADRGNTFLWELLSRALAIMVSQGLIEKAKLESYHAHFYAPSKEEIEYEVGRQGSFKQEQLEIFHVEMEGEGESCGSAVARTVRAVHESTFVHHLGVGEEVLDTLFKIYGGIVDEEIGKEEIKPLTFVLVLRKI